jgi:Bacteriocin-protection, YdeI or OmpD-Associated/Domain of unknown function (DUF1905)
VGGTLARVGSLTFTAKLAKRGPAAAVVLDNEQVAAVGEGAKLFPVVATINGHTWRSTVVRMRGEFVLGLSKDLRRRAGVEAGDEVRVELKLDREERTVEAPEVLAQALARDPDASAAYDRLAYAHRKEFARWIEEARRDETRARRVDQTLEMLHAGRTRS